MGLSQNWTRSALRDKLLSSALWNSRPHCKQLRNKNAKTKRRPVNQNCFWMDLLDQALHISSDIQESTATEAGEVLPGSSSKLPFRLWAPAWETAASPCPRWTPWCWTNHRTCDSTNPSYAHNTLTQKIRILKSPQISLPIHSRTALSPTQWLFHATINYIPLLSRHNS